MTDKDGEDDADSVGGAFEKFQDGEISADDVTRELAKTDRDRLVFDTDERIAWLCRSCRQKLDDWEGLMDVHELCAPRYRVWAYKPGEEA